MTNADFCSESHLLPNLDICEQGSRGISQFLIFHAYSSEERWLGKVRSSLMGGLIEVYFQMYFSIALVYLVCTVKMSRDQVMPNYVNLVLKYSEESIIIILGS